MAQEENFSEDWISGLLSSEVSDDVTGDLAPSTLEADDTWDFQLSNSASPYDNVPSHSDDHSEGNKFPPEGVTVPVLEFNCGLMEASGCGLSPAEQASFGLPQSESLVFQPSSVFPDSDTKLLADYSASPADQLLTVSDNEEGKYYSDFLSQMDLDGAEMLVKDSLQSGRELNSDGSEAGHEDTETAKRQARLMRNRESAQLSRQRKKVYVNELEAKLRTLQATVAELNATIAHLTAENVNLRKQLAPYAAPSTAAGGKAPLPSSSFLPYGMFGFPRMGIPGFVPSVAIPRLKSCKPATEGRAVKRAAGASVRGKRVKKAAEGAGVIAMAVFCLVTLFSPLNQSWNLPVAPWGSSLAGLEASALLPYNEGLQHRGRVLMSAPERSPFTKDSGQRREAEAEGEGSEIHSGLKGLQEEGPLKIPVGVGPKHSQWKLKHGEVQRLKSMAVVSMERQKGGMLKALPAGKGEKYSPKGELLLDELPHLLQDFNGLSPLLAHGFCSEVFQFETSVAEGSAEVENSSVSTASVPREAESKGRSLMRRMGGIRGSFPVPLPPASNGSDPGVVKQQGQGGSKSLIAGLNGTALPSPQEKESGGSQTQIAVSLFSSASGLKGFGKDEESLEDGQLSRVFVVVLLNGVKYVTYSCNLPNVGSQVGIV